jgi:hypothetical protein
MVSGPKPSGDSLLCRNLNGDLVALTIPRSASQATHTLLSQSGRSYHESN